MKTRECLLCCLLYIVCALNVFAGETFQPRVFWGNDMNKGILLVNHNEMLVIDSTGNRYKKVVVKEGVNEAYLSPDFKKIAYTTLKELRIVDIETQNEYIVATGFCDYFRWNTNGLSFIFAVGEFLKETQGNLYDIKFFWADGDGKNIKQIYP
ncbi:MAG: hypothetical protein COT17_03035 [Elusimicrobia bacterium CG08_land_8_20_14_0_20_51_18]|nr:MAG: hypothetical protein COT17_03035 [Elusimicrobia bacterium CG08_land_8_20_14_0_20_51_18]